MSTASLSLVFFVYGLAFFSMGLLVAIEGGRGQDIRLKRALRPLAGFGLIHGIHEWLEMFQMLGIFPFEISLVHWEAARLAFLAFSFLSLSAFGALLLTETDQVRRLGLLVPLVQSFIWGAGIFWMTTQYNYTRIWAAADVWSRYVLGIPAALIACAGLIGQQRAFRRAGMAQFGRDSLWAAVGFAWYGLIGQLFTRPSVLPPSTILNQDLFLYFFGFPVQVLRAVAASVAAFFVVRFLRAFEVEQQSQIAALQAARLYEARRREALRGDLLRRVVAAQEQERQRVARELHDETGQALTAIGLGLRGVASTLRVDVDQAAKNLRQLETLATRSLDELQRLIADLRPSHLDDLGLLAALRWYANEMQERTHLQVTVQVTGPPRNVSGPIKIAVFRIVQEALTNIVKYAQTHRAEVHLLFGERTLSVRIHDNGIGFDPSLVTSQNRSSWGLLGMQERAALLDGEFDLDSMPGQGTTVHISIPYQQVVFDRTIPPPTMGTPHTHSTTADEPPQEVLPQAADLLIEADEEEDASEHTPVTGG